MDHIDALEHTLFNQTASDSQCSLFSGGNISKSHDSSISIQYSVVQEDEDSITISAFEDFNEDKDITCTVSNSPDITKNMSFSPIEPQLVSQNPLLVTSESILSVHDESDNLMSNFESDCSLETISSVDTVCFPKCLIVNL